MKNNLDNANQQNLCERVDLCCDDDASKRWKKKIVYSYLLML